MAILIVDDDDTTRQIIRGILKDMGLHAISEAKDGLMAMDILQREKVELIISDWRMPKMSGLELLNEVRHSETLHHIPFIMVTTQETKDTIMEAITAKVTQYVVKPFSAQILTQKILSALRKASG